MKRLLHAFGSTAALLVTNFGTGILIARLLGPEHRGELSQIVAWFSFLAPVALLGLNDSIVYFSVRHEELRSKVLASGLAVSFVTMALALSLCISAILLHLKYLSQDAQLAAWLFLCFAPLYQQQQIFSSYLQATHRTGAWTIVRTLPSPAYFLGIIVVTLMGYATVSGIVIANVVSLLISVVVGVYFVWTIDGKWGEPSRSLIGELFNYGHPLTWQRLSIVCRDNLDRMILPFFISASALGNYVVAATFATVVFVVGMTIDAVSFPAIARSGDTKTRIATAERFIALSVVLMTLVVAIIAPFSRELVVSLFGRSYLSAASLVPIFLVVGALQAIRGIIGSAFKAFARTRTLAGIEALSSAIMLAVLLAFGKSLGPLAGVLAHLVSAALTITLAVTIATRTMGLSLSRMIIPRAKDIRQIAAILRLRLLDATR